MTGLSASEPQISPLTPRHTADRDRASAKRGLEHPPGSAPNPLPCPWPTRAPLQQDDLGHRQPRWTLEPSGLPRTPLELARRLRGRNKRRARRCGAPQAGMQRGRDDLFRGRRAPTRGPGVLRDHRLSARFVVPRRDVRACRGTGSAGARSAWLNQVAAPGR